MKKLLCALIAGAVLYPAFAQEVKKPESKKVEKGFINELKTAKEGEKGFINEQKTAKKGEKGFIDELKVEKKAPAKK
jgi:hypothetical protein